MIMFMMMTIMVMLSVHAMVVVAATHTTRAHHNCEECSGNDDSNAGTLAFTFGVYIVALNDYMGDTTIATGNRDGFDGFVVCVSYFRHNSA